MKKAFTLIELLVVVLIIGILSAIALPQYQRAVEKARSVEAMQNLSALERAIDIYLLENGYPATAVHFTGASKQDVLDIAITGGMDCSDTSDCDSQHFAYNSYCDHNHCIIDASRHAADVREDGYGLVSWKNIGDKNWTRRCDYGETKEYICAGLESQGYERSSCC